MNKLVWAIILLVIVMSSFIAATVITINDDSEEKAMERGELFQRNMACQEGCNKYADVIINEDLYGPEFDVRTIQDVLGKCIDLCFRHFDYTEGKYAEERRK